MQPSSPCFHCRFLVSCYSEGRLWPSEFLPESSRDHRVKNNLHFDSIKTAELHFSVIAALTSRPCCCFIITRKPQSFIQTADWKTHWELLKYCNTLPLQPSPNTLDSLVFINGFKLIFPTSENGMRLQQTDNDFFKKSQEGQTHCKQDECMCKKLCENICYEQCSRLTHIIKNYSIDL